MKKILGRPKNETRYVLVPIGYPAKGMMVPNIERKAIDEILIWNRP